MKYSYITLLQNGLVAVLILSKITPSGNIVQGLAFSQACGCFGCTILRTGAWYGVVFVESGGILSQSPIGQRTKISNNFGKLTQFVVRRRPGLQDYDFGKRFSDEHKDFKAIGDDTNMGGLSFGGFGHCHVSK